MALLSAPAQVHAPYSEQCASDEPPEMNARAREWKESETPIHAVCRNRRDIMSDFKVLEAPGKSPMLTRLRKGEASDAPPDAVRLFAIPSVVDIVDIDPINETFTVKFTLYLIWPVDLHAIAMGKVADQAPDSGEYVALSPEQIEHFSKATLLPGVAIANAVETFDTPEPEIRVYGGCDVPQCSWVMWNRSMHAKVRERWELHDFPFDVQELSVSLRLSDPRSWDHFNLSVCAVQFHREALTLTEYYPLSPSISRLIPPHKATAVRMRVRRNPNYYLQNIVLMMFLLSLLGPLTFVLDVDALGDRLSTVLTLLLTAVAFKFVVSSTLPKVPYSTLMDYFILASTLSLVLMAFLCVIPKMMSPRVSESVATTVNMALGLLCLGIAIGIPVVWAVAATLVTRRQQRTDCVEMEAEKNWYLFQFSDVSFIPVPPELVATATKRGSHVRPTSAGKRL